MSPRLRSRIALAASAATFALATVLFLVMAPRAELMLGLALLLVAVPVGVIVSGFTEPYLVGPAERFMNLVIGFGTKGQDAEFDEKGVPVVSIRRLGEKFYNPVAVAMAAMRHYDEWEESGSGAAFEAFRNCSDSLVDNLVFREADGTRFDVWEYKYPFTYDLAPPWISGLAQGVGVQVLSRCYRLTGEDTYRIAARHALRSFFISVEDGGVTYKDDEGTWWYEEFVGQNAKVSRVLNGMVYALLGIREYGGNTGDEDAELLYREGTACLKNNLHKYDAGWWTYYDVLGTLATRSYHAVHVDLMRQMFEATGDVAFRDVYHRWSGYNTHFFLREFLRSRPSRHDIVVLAFNIAGVWLALRLAALLWTG